MSDNVINRLNIANRAAQISLDGETKITQQNVQFMFAELMMELSQNNKNAALEKIDLIRKSQLTSSNFTDTINTLRTLGYDFDKYGPIPSLNTIQEHLTKTQQSIANLDSAIKGLNGQEKKLVSLDPALNTYMQSLGKTSGYDDIHRGNSDNLHYLYELKGAKATMEARLDMLQKINNLLTNSENKQALLNSNIDFNTAITKDGLAAIQSNLESTQETLGADIQQQMVYVQDYMGQYNSYTQGSMSAISQASETLKAVARGS